MRNGPPVYASLAAVALGAAALLLSLLMMMQATPPSPAAQPAAPAALDLSLIITGMGAAGEPATHHSYNPQMIVARQGDRVRLRVMNLAFATHGIEIQGYGVRTGALSAGPHGQETITFVADKVGVFPYRCYIPFDPKTGACSPDHDTQVGYLVVLDGAR